MKLVDNDIKKIDLFLEQNGIKFLDVRYELMDHLVSEFENDSQFALLEDFLNSKKSFVKEILKKKRSLVHWSYQRKLWVRFASFFKKPLLLLGTSALLFLMVWLSTHLSEKGYKIAFSTTIILPITLSIFLYFKRYAKYKKLVQGEYLFNIMAFPNSLIYFLPLLKDFIPEYPVILSFYWWFVMMLIIAGFVEFITIRKKVIAQYNALRLL